MFLRVITIIALAIAPQGLWANEDSLIYGEATKLDSFDPYTSHEAAAQRLSELIFDPLFKPLPQGGYEPHLVASYKITDGGAAIFLKLKSNISWHSSIDKQVFLNANDVATTIRLITSKASEIPNSDRWNSIGRVEIIDQMSMKIHFKIAQSDPLKLLTFRVLPHHILQAQDGLDRKSDFTNNPVGTGPYRLTRTNNQGEALLEANEAYFLGSPKIKKVIMKTYADQNIMAQSLMYNSLDLVTYVSPRDLGEVMGDRNLGVIPYDALSFTFIALNNQRKHLKDRKVRQAINYALNRSEMIDAFFQNKGTIISGPFPPTSWAYNLNVRPYPFDPKRAQMLLEAGGYKKKDNKWLDNTGNNLKLQFAVPIGGESETVKRIALATQGYLAEVGIEVELKFLEWSQWKQRILGEHDYDMTMASWSFDDSSNITSLFHSGHAKDWGNNFVNYRNTTVDALLTEANATNDFDKRRAIYQKLHALIADDVPYAFLWTLMHHAAYQSHISNVQIEPNAFFKNVGTWTLRKGDNGKSAQ